MPTFFRTQAMLDVSELEKFRKLANNLQNKVLRQAGNAGARVIRDAVIPFIPTESFSLKRSMSVKQKTYPKGVVVNSIGPRKDYTAWVTNGRRTVSFLKILTNNRTTKRRPVKYSHLVHNGTKPHTIRLTFAGKLIHGRRATRVITVHHPGTAPNPFITRGFQVSESRAISVWSSTAAEAIEREMRS